MRELAKLKRDKIIETESQKVEPKVEPIVQKVEPVVQKIEPVVPVVVPVVVPRVVPVPVIQKVKPNFDLLKRSMKRTIIHD